MRAIRRSGGGEGIIRPIETTEASDPPPPSLSIQSENKKGKEVPVFELDYHLYMLKSFLKGNLKFTHVCDAIFKIIPFSKRYNLLLVFLPHIVAVIADLIYYLIISDFPKSQVIIIPGAGGGGSSYILVYTDVQLEWANFLTNQIYQWDAIFINLLYQLACHYINEQ